MSKHNDLGKKGEDAACNYLLKENYEILKRNWRYGKYELDIIARNDEYIVFVEVKTRSSDQWGNPEDAVSRTKMKRMVEAADSYLKQNDVDMDVRFDIISAIWNGEYFEIDHIDDAFFAPVN
ncbi:YraN family protein [Dysgonomonas sp. 520]|uniref:YraN family protein n=1 Tax=Dysgonomonas sp. 520 TaxID=2302931 RepID=UPI0013D3AA77|nr:YraN family protein [Dysgonomonas sp. 520]NDW11042.1 YraN family protein [Dysgonomonas sp. 520]